MPLGRPVSLRICAKNTCLRLPYRTVLVVGNAKGHPAAPQESCAVMEEHPTALAYLGIVMLFVVNRPELSLPTGQK